MAGVVIVEGAAVDYVNNVLRLSDDAFAKKFRLGFREANDLIRIIGDPVEKTRCFAAIVDGPRAQRCRSTCSRMSQTRGVAQGEQSTSDDRTAAGRSVSCSGGTAASAGARPASAQ